MGITPGDILQGRVTGITKFGAFVELAEGITGLVHISEVANSYVKEISDFLKVNDEVTVKVVNIGDNGKIGLSIKQAQIAPPPPPLPPSFDEALPFEDKLAKFLKDSNEKLVALKRHQEGRRGGR
ncbi:MAG: S1 RNA-binding domain-containing protein [Clostridia bacterium]|nr:S1 RNA-binding domain-containing protein [Clostridia bacterium]